jgi:hypothetical protein
MGHIGKVVQRLELKRLDQEAAPVPDSDSEPSQEPAQPEIVSAR